MELTFFIKGTIAGFLLCAPIGPVGIWCLRRTVADGRMLGMVHLRWVNRITGVFVMAFGAILVILTLMGILI